MNSEQRRIAVIILITFIFVMFVTITLEFPNNVDLHEPSGHQVGAYSGFCSMKRLGVFIPSPQPGEMQSYPQH